MFKPTASQINTSIQMDIREAKLARRALQRTAPKYVEPGVTGEFTTGKFRALANRLDALIDGRVDGSTLFPCNLREAKLIRRALRWAARCSNYSFASIYSMVANRVDAKCQQLQPLVAR